MGAEPVLLSTRMPDPRLMTHAWAREAMAATTYLYPLTPTQVLEGVWHIITAGPRAWARLLHGITSAGPKRWIRNAALALLGAHLACVARKLGFAHVHVHSCADAAYIAAFAAAISPLTYSVVLHGALSFYGPGQRFKWKHASFGLLVSEHLREDVLPVLLDGDDSKLAVAPMGVDLKRFERGQPYVPWTRGSGPLKLVSCGRLNAGKGHQDLIGAVALLRDRGLDVKLRICGEDDHGGDGFRRDLEHLIAKQGLANHVVLLGAVDESVVCQELATGHIFALASHAEAIGVAYMEAMAMAMPVIGSKVGGVPDLIDDDREGILVPPMNPRALADAIERVAMDEALAARLASSARKRIEKQFSSERSAKAVIEGINKHRT